MFIILWFPEMTDSSDIQTYHIHKRIHARNTCWCIKRQFYVQWKIKFFSRYVLEQKYIWFHDSIEFTVPCSGSISENKQQSL